MVGAIVVGRTDDVVVFAAVVEEVVVEEVVVAAVDVVAAAEDGGAGRDDGEQPATTSALAIAASFVRCRGRSSMPMKVLTPRHPPRGTSRCRLRASGRVRP